MEELAVLFFGAVGLALGLDELEDEGAARADVVPAREEVAADEGLQDARLAAALAADNRHLRKVDGGLAADAGEDVLQAVHQRDHGGAQRSSSGGGGGRWCSSGSIVRHDWIGSVNGKQGKGRNPS